MKKFIFLDKETLVLAQEKEEQQKFDMKHIFFEIQREDEIFMSNDYFTVECHTKNFKQIHSLMTKSYQNNSITIETVKECLDLLDKHSISYYLNGKIMSIETIRYSTNENVICISKQYHSEEGRYMFSGDNITFTIISDEQLVDAVCWMI